MLHINRLIWDSQNEAHVGRHEVRRTEVEEVCQNRFVASQTYAERIRLIGPTKSGRMLTIILAPKAKAAYYPVTAHPASRKERRRYLELQGGEKIA